MRDRWKMLHQPLERQSNAHLVHRVLDVGCEGVIHVETNDLDQVKAEVAVAVDLAWAFDEIVFGTQHVQQRLHVLKLATLVLTVGVRWSAHVMPMRRKFPRPRPVGTGGVLRCKQV